MDDTLELLRSLTKGVNNKINQEQNKSIEYIVNTSLKNKDKKVAPPVIKEVITNSSEDIEEGIIEGDLLLEDNLEELSEENIEGLSEDFIIEDSVIDGDIVEDYNENNSSIINDSEIIEDSLNENDEFVGIEFENKSEKIENDIEDKYLENEETKGLFSEVEDIREKNEGIENNINSEREKFEGNKKSEKIQRNGNPFKRGPRKKKEQVVSENVIKNESEEDINLKENNFSDKNNVESDKIEKNEGSVSIEVDEVSENELEDYFNEVELGDNSNENEIEQSFNEVDLEENSNESELEKDFDRDELKEDFNENKDINIKEETDLSNIDIEESNNLDDSDIDINGDEEESEEDKKFKDCVYYKGMEVEDFLRENPLYRTLEYVEHFYSKELLNKMLLSGLLLFKKGKYIL